MVISAQGSRALQHCAPQQWQTNVAAGPTAYMKLSDNAYLKAAEMEVQLKDKMKADAEKVKKRYMSARNSMVRRLVNVERAT